MLKAYASDKPLEVIGTFKALLSVNDQKPSETTEFFIVRGARKSLLCKTTSEALLILKVGLEVRSIEERARETPTAAFPKFPNVQIKIVVDETVPPKKVFYYRVPVGLEETVNQKLKLMEDMDIIEKVKGSSDWISPLVVVPKPNGDIRICVNMKNPNKAIMRENFPLPSLESFMTKLSGSKFFSKLDIHQAYYHVELHPDSRALTTFMTSTGLMRYKRIVLGMTSAPEIFQKLLEEMLGECKGTFNFQDDILIVGKNLGESNERIGHVLKILKENNVWLNKEKCKFNQTEIEFLGQVLTENGMRPSETKIKALRDFRKPEGVEEIRSFLGLITFVSHFIENLSTKTEPLRAMIRKEVKVWGKSQQTAFDALRQELAEKILTLGYFDPKHETMLFTDGSPFGLGAVLVQKHEGVVRIITCVSKSLTHAEQRYPQTQREALAVVWAVERLYFYLFGLHFTIMVDHRSLEFIFGDRNSGSKRACSRAEGWQLRLQPYKYTIKYIPGKGNIADTLSRLCAQIDEAFEEESPIYLAALLEEHSAISMELIAEESETDDEIRATKVTLTSGVWGENLVKFQAFAEELHVRQRVLMREDRAVLPKSLREKAMKIAHRGHPGAVTMKRTLRDSVWWPRMDKDIAQHAKDCRGCTVVARQDPPPPMKRYELPAGPWQYLAMDFLNVPEIGTNFLVLTDYFSRFLVVKDMKITDAGHVKEVLEKIFIELGFPSTIQADNGPPFNSKELGEYFKSRNVKSPNTVPLWPQMNGEVERQNRGIVRALKIAKAENIPWKLALTEYVNSYNERPHSITQLPPKQVLMNRPIKNLLPLPMVSKQNEDENMREDDAIAKLMGKIYSDKRRHARDSDIRVGDTVLVKNLKPGKLEPNFMSTPFKVVEKVQGDTTVQNEEGIKYRRHVSHLKRFPGTRGEDEQQEPSSSTSQSDPEHSAVDEEEEPDTNFKGKKLQPPRKRKPPSRLISEMNQVN